MSALDMAARLIGQCEGFRSAPYQDSAGIWTIGLGTIRIDGTPVTASTAPIDMDRATELMDAELQPTAGRVDELAPPDATDAQLAACYSFTYNLGTSAFASSSLLSKWLAGDVLGAADGFLLWNKAHVNGVLTIIRGLTVRRQLERGVFLETVRV